MASKQAREAYPDIPGWLDETQEPVADLARRAFDRGAVTALREAAREARSEWERSGNDEAFRDAEWLDRMADEWEASGE